MEPEITRITPEMVEAAVVGETYIVLPDGRTTICQLTLKNNYTVDGKSACVDPANFDQAVGREWARKDALRKIWPLLGFALASKLSGEAMV